MVSPDEPPHGRAAHSTACHPDGGAPYAAGVRGGGVARASQILTGANRVFLLPLDRLC